MKTIFRKIDPAAATPEYAHPGDAGMDVRSIEDAILAPGERRVVRTGLTIELPAGFEAQVRPRSGLAARHGVTVLNSPGTIDEGYRGEIGVILANFGQEPFAVERGMKIAQLVIAPVVRAEIVIAEGEASATERGAGGFGSTGL